MTRAVSCLALALAPGIASCGGDDEAAPPAPLEIVRPEELCDRIQSDAYVAGVERASADGSFRVKILDAAPAPPAAGDNTWTVQLLGEVSAGAPRVSAARDGRIGSAHVPTVTVVDGAPRVFRIGALLLGIPGRWEIALRPSADDPRGDRVATFAFCVTS